MMGIRSFLVAVILVLVLAVVLFFLGNAKQYGDRVIAKSQLLGATASKSTDGDVLITLPSDTLAATEVLEHVRNDFYIKLVSDRIALKDLDLEILETDDTYPQVYSVSVSRPGLLDASDLASLRLAFPNCTLWEFGSVLWSDETQRQVTDFPSGSSISCGGVVPEEFEEGRFTVLGRNGITWTHRGE